MLLSREEILARVLYKDDHIIVLNKPPGIAVHPGKGKGPNLEPFFKDLCFELQKPPALAHRLDSPTSGCLVLGRHPQALKHLGKLFALGKIIKKYWALVNGRPVEDEGEINLPLAKQTEAKNQWWMKVDQNGQESKTLYKVLGISEEYTWVELTPLTGRTHQLRVHCAAMGWPIVGDQIYGPPSPLKKLMLHAVSISIPYKNSQEYIDVQAPPPNLALWRGVQATT
jgi:tRNA pseudouridine32 synthase/23S rRNA pseudouridine746 synthase